jgi:hypothetical protein
LANRTQAKFLANNLILFVAIIACARAGMAQPVTTPAGIPATTHPATQPTPLDPAVAALLNDLGDVDPAIRERATEKLLAMGPAALPPLGRVAHAADPEVRHRAVEMLHRLPWYAPGDSPRLRAILFDFGAMRIRQRRGIVRWLAELKDEDREAGWRALGRILQSDPDYEVSAPPCIGPTCVWPARNTTPNPPSANPWRWPR